jgi:hypothetical protein
MSLEGQRVLSDVIPPSFTKIWGTARGSWVRAGVTFLLMLVLFGWGIWDSVKTGAPSSNLHVLQADAFLRGKIELDHYCFDCAEYRGHVYVPFPPAPSLLLVPMIFVFGQEHVNPSLIAALLMLVDVGLAFALFRRLRLNVELSLWLTAAFLLGTACWVSVKQSDGVWFFSHVCATTGLTLALFESFGKGRGFLVGMALGLALLSRQFTVLSAPLFAVLLWQRPALSNRHRYGRLLSFSVVVALALGAYLGFNELRFDSPLETGYGLLRREGFVLQRFRKHGLFSPAYVPFNLTYLFLQGFHVEFASAAKLSRLELDAFGTGLFQASPFLLTAFFARNQEVRGVRAAVWLTSAAIALGHSFYYLNGFCQTNTQRFTLDFLPILFVLCAWGLRAESDHGRARLWKGAILYSIFTNSIFLVFWEPLNRILSKLG